MVVILVLLICAAILVVVVGLLGALRSRWSPGVVVPGCAVVLTDSRYK